MRRRVTDTGLLSTAAKQVSPKSASNNQHLQFLSFYRLGIWIPLSCVAIKVSAETSHFSGDGMNLCPGWFTPLAMGRKLHIP